MKLLLFGIALGAGIGAGHSAHASFVSLDPRSTFLSDDTGATNPTILDLSTFGVAPGSYLFMHAVGDVDVFGGGQPEQPISAIGVFSSSSTLLDSNQLNRVPGAIATTLTFVEGDSFYGRYREIAEDFLIDPTGVTVQIPGGAQFLFLGAYDSHYGFNADYNNDFGVSITQVPEPGASVAALAIFALGIVVVARRVRQIRATST